MDSRSEVREFLTSRRAKVTPQQAGLSVVGQRRVPGLRRSEVASLAGAAEPPRPNPHLMTTSHPTPQHVDRGTACASW